MRGQHGSRLEAFSDAVFAFALTLLVVSLEVPENVAALRDVLNGFPAFAATFAIICWIWYQHVTFFQRFGLDDVPTVMLNCVLLFLVLFFVYPLKFTFSGMFGPAGIALTIADARWLLVVYSAGFIAVFAVFVVLHANAYRQRARLGFDTLESHDASAGVRTHLLSVGVGALALALAAVLPAGWLWTSGVTFTLLGPVHLVNGYLVGRSRERLAAGRATG